jgi:hypothetical protein
VTGGKPVKCRKAKKLLITYMMDEKNEKLKEHLTTCSDCADELETLKKTWNLLDVSEEINLPEHLAWRIERQVASLAGIDVKNQGRWFAPACAALGAAGRLRWSLVGAGLAFACCILAFLLLKPFIAPGTGVQAGMSAQAGEIKIGFYLAEHERAAQYVSYYAVSSTPSSPRWIPMQREDMFYYDGSEKGDSGLFLRSQNGPKNIPEKEPKPKLTESEIIPIPPPTPPSTGGERGGRGLSSLSEAQKSMPFPIVAPEVLRGSYKLELALNIKDRECVQLIYSDGVHTLSLFEQPIWTKNGIGRKDFQEYILHKAKEGSKNAILGWLTKEIAFNLVGEAEFSELIRLAEEIQEKITTDKLQGFYEELYGKGWQR